MAEVRSRFSDEKLSRAYAKYRPVYSNHIRKLYYLIYMKSKGCSGYDVAIDVACGSGQSTFLLADLFQNVTGIDVSKTQVDEALRKMENSTVSNVDFIVGDAHDLQIESSSVDLLTCAMGWHWLDPRLFYAEAKRVLKQGVVWLSMDTEFKCKTTAE